MVTGSGQSNKKAAAEDNLNSANNELADFEARLLQQHMDKKVQGKPKYKVPLPRK